MPKRKKQTKSSKRKNDLEKHKAQLKSQLKDLGEKIYSDLNSQKFPLSIFLVDLYEILFMIKKLNNIFLVLKLFHVLPRISNIFVHLLK